MMEIDDDNDCVIKEIPVHVCKQLSNNLHLFQFPCQTADTSSCSRNVVSSRIKPESGLIELDYGLNPDSEFYDKYVGEELAPTEPKPNTKDKIKSSSSKLMDKITFRSHPAVLKKDVHSYSVASIYDGKFCITPIQKSVRFLPSYNHVENSKRSRAGSKSTAEDSSSSDEDDVDKTSSAVQVTVKFSQKREKSKVSQELTHQQYLTKVAEEPWFETTYLNSSSSTAIRLLEGLTSTVSRNRSAMLSLSQKQYLEVLVPPDISDDAEID